MNEICCDYLTPPAPKTCINWCLVETKRSFELKANTVFSKPPAHNVLAVCCVEQQEIFTIVFRDDIRGDWFIFVSSISLVFYIIIIIIIKIVQLSQNNLHSQQQNQAAYTQPYHHYSRRERNRCQHSIKNIFSNASHALPHSKCAISVCLFNFHPTYSKLNIDIISYFKSVIAKKLFSHYYIFTRLSELF